MSNDLRDNMIRALYSSALRLGVLGLLLLAGVTSARADDLNFVLSDGTGKTMSWTLPSMPIPSNFNSTLFAIDGVTVTEFNGTTTSTVTAHIEFFNLGVNDGGISGNFTTLFNTFDYMVYSGPEATPTFIPGTYTEPATEDDVCGPGVTECDQSPGVGDTWALSTSNDANLTLTITTPEPSSKLLLCTGLLGLMGMGLRRMLLA